MKNTKRLLIVDDSEIDRSILKNILSRCFEVIEAENGYTALEIITKKNTRIDGILLDISMPFLDGFNVLEIMEDNNIKIPIIIVTAEATAENVQHSAKFEVMDFIRKPFDPQVILEKMEHIFGLDSMLSTVEMHHESHVKSEYNEPDSYISRLSFIYKKFLKNIGLDDLHYSRVSMLVEIMLGEYSHSNKARLDTRDIKIISQAAFFYDIGFMGIPTELILKTEFETEEEREIYNSHTVIGANIVKLNSSEKCEFFAEVCSDMCMHHHVRFDESESSNYSVYSQICGIAIQFDQLFAKRKNVDAAQFEFILNELKIDKDAFSPALIDTLSACREKVLRYYKMQGKTHIHGQHVKQP